MLSKTLDDATTQYLMNNRSPSRKCGELDNRGSHFYLALYWAQALAAQSEDAGLAARFAGIAETMAANESTIIDELNGVQGRPMDIGGYFLPDSDQATEAMRPSQVFNEILDGLLEPA